MKTFCVIVAALALSSITFAQVAPVAPAKPSNSKPASVESVNTILKAEHELDLVKNDMADIAQQFQALQKQADVLNPRFKDDQVKAPAAQAKVDAALDAVYQANGVSKDKYTFDPANFTLTEKPSAPIKAAALPSVPPVTPAAEKTPIR
jgi:hypothetical protein